MYVADKGRLLPTKRLYVYLRWKHLMNQVEAQTELLKSLEGDEIKWYQTLEKQLKDRMR
jgi:hypothetical protein